MTIFTIGYEGITAEQFIGLLEKYDIEMLVDVRNFPLSRKRGFSKNALTDILIASGREYIHMQELGCPKEIRNNYREDGDWKRYTSCFLQYLRTKQDDLTRLVKLAESKKCALLCFESDHNYCHRKMVADAVHDLCRVRVSHIKAKASVQDSQLVAA